MTNSHNLTDKSGQRFRSLALLTIVIVYLVVLAGGVVRGTGSGMGCPDWPKCFGRWIPPTELSQLPPNYQQIYGAKLKGEIEFNAVKTWIEYVNRLLGVLSGFFVFATLIASLSYLKKDKVVFWGSLAAFILIGLNGWLGSRVVATELAQYMITLHLLLAVLVVLALLFVFIRSNPPKEKFSQPIKSTQPFSWFLLVTMVLTTGQVLMGTVVRETLDEVIKEVGYTQRANWISSLDWHFYVHRSFSLVVLALHIAIIYRLRHIRQNQWLHNVANWLLVLVIAEILTGVVMAYLEVPAVAQPIHLLLAIIIVGLQFLAWLALTPGLIPAKQYTEQPNLLKV
ncbi:COX15/CtaA family protein [Spirosoma sp. SC4-14]|uniref:COX15/CtaA family protein n=1 Tax=Spirosoma sp. SC4-14 TaxID=3128900 RepID=UPI0030D5E032